MSMDAKAYLWDADLALKHGEAAAALKIAEAIAKEYPAEAGMITVRAHLVWDDMASAKSVLAQLMQRYPGYSATHIAAACVHMAERNNREAAKSARRAAECDPFDAGTQTTAAYLSFRAGDYHQAVEFADNTIALVGHIPILIAEAAEYNMMAGHHDRAVQLIDTVVFEPDSEEAAYAARTLLSIASYSVWKNYHPRGHYLLSPTYTSDGPSALVSKARSLAPNDEGVQQWAEEVMEGFRAADTHRHQVVRDVMKGLLTTFLASGVAAWFIPFLLGKVAAVTVMLAAAGTAYAYWRAFYLPEGWSYDVGQKYRKCDSFKHGAAVLPVLIEALRLRKRMESEGYKRVVVEHAPPPPSTQPPAVSEEVVDLSELPDYVPDDLA